MLSVTADVIPAADPLTALDEEVSEKFTRRVERLDIGSLCWRVKYLYGECNAHHSA